MKNRSYHDFAIFLRQSAENNSTEHTHYRYRSSRPLQKNISHPFHSQKVDRLSGEDSEIRIFVGNVDKLSGMDVR